MLSDMKWSSKDMERFESRQGDGVWVVDGVAAGAQISPPAGRAYPLSMLLAMSRPNLNLITAALLCEVASNWAKAVGDASLALDACRRNGSGFDAVLASKRFTCLPTDGGGWQTGALKAASIPTLMERLERHLAQSAHSAEVEIDIQMARDLRRLAESGSTIILRQQRLDPSAAARGQLQTLIDDHRARLHQLCELEIERLQPTLQAQDVGSNVVPLASFQNGRTGRR